MDQHYAGDDTNVLTLGKGVLAAFGNISVEEFEEQADAFLRSAAHPTLDRPYLACAFTPMLEVLGHLEAHGFANYIASGGGRDFMRPISDEVYGVPREHVIGSGTRLSYTPDPLGGSITREVAPDYLDDGPEKPVHIWTRTGRRPVLAAGNSNGDIEMLEYSQREGSPSLRLLVLHDDPEREFEYVGRRGAGPRPGRRERLDGGEHEERLGDGVLRASAGKRDVRQRRCLLRLARLTAMVTSSPRFLTSSVTSANTRGIR